MADRMESRVFADARTGRPVRQLTSSSLRSVHGYYDLCPWSPDGRWIAFTRMAAPGAEEGVVCVMPAAGGAVTELARTRSVKPNGGAMAQWASDSRRVYFKDREDGRELLAWADATSGERGAVPGGLRMIDPSGRRQAYSAFSREIAAPGDARAREQHGVVIQDLAGGERRLAASLADCLPLQPDPASAAALSLFIKHTKWSPDGSRLLFVLTDKSGKGAGRTVKDLYVVGADGADLRRVGEFGNHPSWHPDGKRILMNASWPGRPGRRLVLVHADTGEREVIEQLSGNPGGHPSFSPDGRYLAVEKVYHPAAREASILLLHAATGRVDELVRVALTDHSHQGTHLHPVWSRDSREVLYASDASGAAQLCVVGV